MLVIIGKMYMTRLEEAPYWKTDSQDGFGIEYVRKDIFIKKAISFIRNCTTYDGLDYKAKCVNIEDFEKYMYESK